MDDFTNAFVREGVAPKPTARDYVPVKKGRGVRESAMSLMQNQLSVPLPESNVGFQLLSKLGFSGEGGLGRNSNGIREPIDSVSTATISKLGVGVLETNKRKAVLDEQRRVARDVMMDESVTRFKVEASDRYRDAATDKSIHTARDLILKFANDEEGVPDFSDSASRADELRRSLVYLRDSHLYCLFCGVRYQSVEDLALNCPGVLEDEH